MRTKIYDWRETLAICKAVNHYVYDVHRSSRALLGGLCPRNYPMKWYFWVRTNLPS